MLVRARKSAPRTPAKPVPAQTGTIPAPVRGWVLNESLIAASPGGARILDNWIPTETGVRARAGCAKYATLPAAVTAMWPYNSGSGRFFAATASGVFEITAPSSPTTVLTAVVSGRTSGAYSACQFGTAGGNYQYLVNGADKPLLYDGSSFTAIDSASTPAITGVTTTNLSHVWSYANRLFFVETGTLKAWYLSVDSIGGAAAAVSLAGVFNRGGTLLFGAKWSLDAGDGLDDKCVFVSTLGEIAIYSGSDPSSASTWSLDGVYQMPPPMGKNAAIQAGGDLLIATEIGLIPISASINNDMAALESKAITAPIAAHWQKQARTISSGWEMMKLPRLGYMLVSQPDTAATTKTALAVNLVTGAWSRITGWDAKCLGYYGNAGYFGAGDGCVYTVESGGSDAGSIYTAVFLGQHESLGAYGVAKSVRQMRAIFQKATPINPQLTAKADFSEAVSAPPSAPVDGTSLGWDAALWDVGLWDSGSAVTVQANWTAVGITGTTIAPELQLTFGDTGAPDVHLVGIDVQYHPGAIVA